MATGTEQTPATNPPPTRPASRRTAIRSRPPVLSQLSQSRSYTRVAGPLLGMLLASMLVYVAARRGALPALAILVAAPLAYWIVRRQGNGYLLAVGVALVVPYFYAHVWEIAPLAGGLGLVAGTARSRPRLVDLAVLTLALWLTASWLFHPQLGITTKIFVQGMLPFQFYLWTRLTLTERLLPKLQWLLLGGAALAALTVLLEAALHTVIFADPQRYQWAGDSSEVFRPGGIFGGSPPAGVALAILFLACAGMLRLPQRRLVRISLGILLVALTATYARSAFVALAGGAIVVAALLPYRRWLPVVLTAFALSIPAFAVATSPSTLSSLTTSKLVSSGVIRSYSNSDRLSFYRLALPLVADNRQHLLFGRGFEALEAPGTEDAHVASDPLLIARGGPHNDYLRAVLEQGIVGLVLMLLWLGGTLTLGIRTVRALPAGSDRRLFVAGLTAAVAAYMLASLFHDMQHNIPDLSIAALVTGVLVSVCSFGDDKVASPPPERPRRAMRPSSTAEHPAHA